MAKPRKTGTAPADAPVRHEDDDPVAVVWPHRRDPIEPITDPINEGSAFVRELRCNLSAMGVTGEAQERAVAERWAARNR